MPNVVRLLTYLAIIFTLGYAATISKPATSITNPQATGGNPLRPFGIPDDFVVQTEDADHHVGSKKTLLLNTLSAIEVICLVGYMSDVGRFRVRDPSLLDGDVLDFQITEPQYVFAFEARYVLWGLYLCALDFKGLPDGDVPLGQGIYYCYFQMPGLGTGQFTYEEAALLNGPSSQLAEAKNATSKSKRQQGLAPVPGLTSNDTIVADPSSNSITSYGSHHDFVRIYNRGVMPLTQLTVYYAFFQVMIARASVPYPAPIPSYSYNTVGLDPFNIRYRAPQTPGAPPPELATVLHGLGQVPRMMLPNGVFTECDFDIFKDNKLVVSGSFRRITGSTSVPAVQVT